MVDNAVHVLCSTHLVALHAHLTTMDHLKEECGQTDAERGILRVVKTEELCQVLKALQYRSSVCERTNNTKDWNSVSMYH